jgi:hypothetical protein
MLAVQLVENPLIIPGNHLRDQDNPLKSMRLNFTFHERTHLSTRGKLWQQYRRHGEA